jgi:hypothetical protein
MCRADDGTRDDFGFFILRAAAAGDENVVKFK